MEVMVEVVVLMVGGVAGQVQVILCTGEDSPCCWLYFFCLNGDKKGIRIPYEEISGHGGFLCAIGPLFAKEEEEKLVDVEVLGGGGILVVEVNVHTNTNTRTYIHTYTGSGREYGLVREM